MRGPETGLVQGLLDWGSITSSGLSCSWYLSAAPSSLCGFIFSSSSHVLARWLSIPQTWLSHIISGGENDLPLPRHPDKHLVFTGPDRVLVGPIPDRQCGRGVTHAGMRFPPKGGWPQRAGDQTVPTSRNPRRWNWDRSLYIYFQKYYYLEICPSHWKCTHLWKYCQWLLNSHIY